MDDDDGAVALVSTGTMEQLLVTFGYPGLRILAALLVVYFASMVSTYVGPYLSLVVLETEIFQQCLSYLSSF